MRHIWSECPTNPCEDHPYTEKENEMKETEELQRMWRTMSESNNSGFFVWDILEYVGDPNPVTIPSYLTPCRDGSYIAIQCFHYWTKEKAEMSLNDCTYSRWQTIEVI